MKINKDNNIVLVTSNTMINTMTSSGYYGDDTQDFPEYLYYPTYHVLILIDINVVGPDGKN